MIAGISLSSPIMNAAGCCCSTKAQLEELLRSNVGAIVTKTGTVAANVGRNFYRDAEFGSINSMGLPNEGYKYYTDFAREILSGINKSSKVIIQSIHPFSAAELEEMVAYISQIKSDKFFVELNVSCPNYISIAIGKFEQFFEILQRSGLKWGVKMFPLFLEEEFKFYVGLFEKYGCSFITAINTLPYQPAIPGFFPCGIGGEFIKKIALHNIISYRKLTKISIIGCGGATIETAPEYLLHADAVQIGTELYQNGPRYFSRL